MPANTTAVRVCSNCDGFPVVAISTTTHRLPNGTLPTLAVACQHCSGTGTVPTTPRVRLAPAGR
jgi:hypothetical protein